VDIRAFDHGEPSLSSVTTVPVYIRHTSTVAPESGLGFADDEYSVEISEDAPVNHLVKAMNILNGKIHNVPVICQITDGNSAGMRRKQKFKVDKNRKEQITWVEYEKMSILRD